MRLLYYVIITLFTSSFIRKTTIFATTSTTPWLRKKEKRIPKVTTFSTPWSWQKYIISFQHYVHYALIIKKNFFFHSVLRSLRRNNWKKNALAKFVIIDNLLFICCYYVHYVVTMTKNKYFCFSTAFTTAWLRKNIFSLNFNTTFTTSWSRLKIYFISNTSSLNDKYSVSIRFVDATVISPSGTSLESYMLY